MTQHDFALVFALPPGSPAPEAHLDALFQDGCDDATVGTGQKGTIGLDFSRDADTADTAYLESLGCAGAANSWAPQKRARCLFSGGRAHARSARASPGTSRS